MFCSDVGTVLKVVTIPRESWHDLEEVVLEEMTVLRVGHTHPGAGVSYSEAKQQLSVLCLL